MLQTEYRLTCNACQKEQEGKRLHTWLSVSWERTDWGGGYSVTNGYGHTVNTGHVCSFDCLVTFGRLLFNVKATDPSPA